MHYFRWYRSGDPGEATPRKRTYEIDTVCSIDGCNQAVKTRGWCEMHYTRWLRHGDPLIMRSSGVPGDRNASWTGDRASYEAIHLRLAKTPVSGPCAVCGAIARHWAYDHADPNERQSQRGAYSVNLAHYFPACVPCHKRLDLSLK